MDKDLKDILPPVELSDKQGIEIIKRAIATDTGWRALAEAIIDSSNPKAKESCIEILKQIAGDRTVPVTIDASADPHNRVKFSDLLIEQLEYYIALADTIKEI